MRGEPLHVEHRIGDRRVVRLIQKWLAAGVLENGAWRRTEKGTPQGATVSPLLANLYLRRHGLPAAWPEPFEQVGFRDDAFVVDGSHPYGVSGCRLFGPGQSPLAIDRASQAGQAASASRSRPSSTADALLMPPDPQPDC